MGLIFVRKEILASGRFPSILEPPSWQPSCPSESKPCGTRVRPAGLYERLENCSIWNPTADLLVQLRGSVWDPILFNVKIRRKILQHRFLSGQQQQQLFWTSVSWTRLSIPHKSEKPVFLLALPVKPFSLIGFFPLTPAVCVHVLAHPA